MLKCLGTSPNVKVRSKTLMLSSKALGRKSMF